jgi:ferredoxin
LSGKKRLGLNLDYPINVGLWPSIAILLLFAWIENVYTRSAVPRDLALMTTIYTAITLTGMFVFGRDKWLSNGEAFSVLYKFLGKFSPIEIRTHNTGQCSNCHSGCEIYEDHCFDCDSCISSAPTNDIELILRPHTIGLMRPFISTFSEMAFIVLMLSIVAFDGLKATPLWLEITNIIYGSLPFLGTRTVQFVNTVGLITLPIIFFLTYAIFSRLTAISSSSNKKSFETLDVCKSFIPALIPIAIAYNIAHYVILIVISGQLFIPIISDPFGLGWNIFSTSSYEPKFDILNAKFIWFTSVVAIVAGHILALYVSHTIALKRFGQNASTLRSQSPMVVLMIFYTISSLWILAQPIVETR